MPYRCKPLGSTGLLIKYPNLIKYSQISSKWRASGGLTWKILLDLGKVSPSLSFNCVKPRVRERSPASRECRDTHSGYLSKKIFFIYFLTSTGKEARFTASWALENICVGISIPFGSNVSSSIWASP